MVSKRIIILPITVLVIGLCACSCGGVVDTLRERAQTVKQGVLRATPPPAPTPQPAVPQPTLTITSPPTPDAESPAAADGQAALRLEVTEEQINTYLQDEEDFSAQGVTASDVHVDLTEEGAIVTGQVHHAETGLDMGLTIMAIPRVVDGAVYLDVQEVRIDDSVSGFTRLIAQAMIAGAIDQYATSHGIPIPVEGIYVETVEMEADRLLVAGSRVEAQP